MIIKHIYRHRKLFVAAVIVAGITYIVSNLHLGGSVNPDEVHHTYAGLSHIKDSQVIDKDMVINSLHKTGKLVGLESTATKIYTYSDSIFEGHNWLKDSIGQRSIELDVTAFFKTGINLSDITDNSVVAYGNSLFVKLPKSELISLDIPFDQIVFKVKTGLIRSELSMEEKQMLYTEIRKIVTNNIMSDETIKTNTYDGVKAALENLLSKVPNCNRIVFSPRLGE